MRRVNIAVYGSPHFIVGLCLVCVLDSGASMGAETGSSDAAAQSATGTGSQLGFASQRSVEGELAETAKRQSEGALARFHRRKKELEDRTGLTYGFENQTQYLATDSDKSPSDAASNVTRFYGVWSATGRGAPDEGALVFKVEYRTAIGNEISTQALCPSFGYAGTFASTCGDAGAVLPNLCWRQHDELTCIAQSSSAIRQKSQKNSVS